jgi:RND family efflux transporter MFP subunit
MPLAKFAILALYMVTCSRLAAGQPAPTPVVVAEAVEREVAAGREFPGTVEPSRRSVVGSAVDGRVLKFPVNSGDWVEEGQPVALLCTKTLQLELEAARGELQLRQHEVEELQNGSRQEEIQQAKAVLARSKALSKYAEARLDRTEELHKRGGTTSLEELEHARLAATTAQQSYIEAKAAYDLAISGPRKKQADQARSRVSIQRSHIALLQDRLEEFTIRAPFDGYVVAEHAEVGEWLSRNEDVTEIVAMDPVEIIVAVPEDCIGLLQPGTPATIRISALPKSVFSADVTRIVPQAELRSRTFPVVITLANPRQTHGHLLKAGMIAQVTLPVGEPRHVVLVPKKALVLGGPSPLVFVLGEDEETKATVVQPVPVKIGAVDDSLIAVSGKISGGQRVVVESNAKLRSGATVRTVPR